MNVVGKVSSFITQGMYSVATPFHPFGGAVDIIVVRQEDGTFRSTPWYVRFGKFQGVLKGTEKLVEIEVNGVEANFHMNLDNSGEAYFVREIDVDKDDNYSITNSDGLDINDMKENEFHGQEGKIFCSSELDGRDERGALGMHRLERLESDCDRIFYEFQDDNLSPEGSVDYSDYDSSRYDNLESVERALESHNSSSEVILVSIDGHILTAPLSSSERNANNVDLSTPQFHLGPDEASWAANYLDNLNDSISEVQNEDTENLNSVTVSPENQINSRSAEKHETESPNCDRDLLIYSRTELTSGGLNRNEVSKSHLELPNLTVHSRKASVVETFKETEELLENFISSHVTSDHTGENNLELPTSCFAMNIDVVADTHIQYINTEAGLQERTNLDVAMEENHCETMYTNDECSSSANPKPPSENSNEDLESNFNAGIHESERPFDENIDGAEKKPILIKGEEPQKQTEVDIIVETKHGAEINPFQYVTNDKESQQRAEVDVSVERKYNEPSVNGDECSKSEYVEPPTRGSNEDQKSGFFTSVEISTCGNLLHAGMGLTAAKDAFEKERVSQEEFKISGTSIMKNKNLIIRLQGKYLPWDKVSNVILGKIAFGLDLPIGMHDAIPVERDILDDSEISSSTPSSHRWRLWPIPFKRVKTLEHSASNASSEEVFVDSESVATKQMDATLDSPKVLDSPRKQILRTNVPTTEQIESLNLKEGQNIVNFLFSTRVLGSQKVEAHIYLWKWNTKIVISDVDGTITKSDVLGQFMPLVGKDWTHSGIARLFSAIKENGYQLLFLSARAIVQAYLTKNFLSNLKQDGKSLPTGPVVISPDGLFPSLYREVIRRAPHEFKIACLEDIKALFPPNYNPFYAGFGNRDTDELSYRKIGIPKGKIFIINPKGEVAINHQIDVKSYTSLHTLVHDMFPPTELVEEEDFNSWNYWKTPLPDMD